MPNNEHINGWYPQPFRYVRPHPDDGPPALPGAEDNHWKNAYRLLARECVELRRQRDHYRDKAQTLSRQVAAHIDVVLTKLELMEARANGVQAERADNGQ